MVNKINVVRVGLYLINTLSLSRFDHHAIAAGCTSGTGLVAAKCFAKKGAAHVFLLSPASSTSPSTRAAGPRSSRSSSPPPSRPTAPRSGPRPRRPSARRGRSRGAATVRVSGSRSRSPPPSHPVTRYFLQRGGRGQQGSYQAPTIWSAFFWWWRRRLR